MKRSLLACPWMLGPFLLGCHSSCQTMTQNLEHTCLQAHQVAISSWLAVQNGEHLSLVAAVISAAVEKEPLTSIRSVSYTASALPIGCNSNCNNSRTDHRQISACLSSFLNASSSSNFSPLNSGTEGSDNRLGATERQPTSPTDSPADRSKSPS